MLGGIHWHRSGGTLGGSTGEQLWKDTQQDPLASRSGGILGGIHWRAGLAGCSAGSAGQLLWRDTRRDPLASSSGGILGGIHWRAALAGYWVGAWCRSIANADSNIRSNSPFLSGGEYNIKKRAPERREQNNGKRFPERTGDKFGESTGSPTSSDDCMSLPNEPWAFGANRCPWNDSSTLKSSDARALAATKAAAPKRWRPVL